MQSDNPFHQEILKGAKKYLIRSIIAPILIGSLFFSCAGTVDLPRAWIYFAIFFAYSTGGSIFFLKYNPELMYYRNQWSKQAKKWDRVLTPFAVMVGVHLQAIVMGLDVRYGWMHIDAAWLLPGWAMWMMAMAISFWAMYKNEHFEATVRIQEDRNHRVITAGPYQFIRHPGYLGFILILFAIPLIIGAGAGLINAGLSTLLILVRTSKEDSTLKNELSGYLEYAGKVRFRIIPGIW